MKAWVSWLYRLADAVACEKHLLELAAEVLEALRPQEVGGEEVFGQLLELAQEVRADCRLAGPGGRPLDSLAHDRGLLREEVWSAGSTSVEEAFECVGAQHRVDEAVATARENAVFQHLPEDAVRLAAPV